MAINGSRPFVRDIRTGWAIFWHIERMRLKDTQCRARNGDQVFRLEHVLVYSELPSPTEVYSDEAFNEALHFADPIVARRRPVIDELSFFKVLVLPRSPMESRDGRKQLQTIWNLNISHEERTEAFNGGATRGFAPQITKT